MGYAKNLVETTCLESIKPPQLGLVKPSSVQAMKKLRHYVTAAQQKINRVRACAHECRVRHRLSAGWRQASSSAGCVPSTRGRPSAPGNSAGQQRGRSHAIRVAEREQEQNVTKTSLSLILNILEPKWFESKRLEPK